MTRYFLLIALFGFLISCESPTTQVSAEVLEELHVSQQDTNYIKELLDRSSEIWRTQPDSANHLSERALKLSEDLNYLPGQALGNKIFGLVNYVKGDNFQALRYWEKSLNLYELAEDFNGQSNLQNNIGAIYSTIGDDSTANVYFKRSLQNAKFTKDPKRAGTAYINMGTVFSNEPDTYDQAIKMYKESIKYFEEIDYTYGKATAFANLGEVFLNQNKLDSALQYFIEANKLVQESHDFQSFNLNNLGEIYFKLNQFQKAEEYYQKAISEAVLSNFKFQESRAIIGLGRINLKLNNPTEAISNFNKVVLDSLVGFQRKGEGWKGLAESYIMKNDLKKAYNAQQQYAKVQDSVVSESYEQIRENDRFQSDLLKINFDNQKKNFELQSLQEKEARLQLTIFLGVLSLLALALLGAYFQMRKSKKNLAKERERSEQILLNILPEETAQELKTNGKIKAKQFDQITVLFTDFKSFSVIAEKIDPSNLVDSVDYYFRNFDSIVEKYGLEKIKTIGDSYMCAGGIPSPNTTHAEDAFKVAIDIREFVEDTIKNPPLNIHPFEIRIGLNTGPVVAGVVGTKKFAYDIWGNTVNLAARMESNSEPGKINVSESTFLLLKDKYNFSYRGEIEVKNGMSQKMYFAEVGIT